MLGVATSSQQLGARVSAIPSATLRLAGGSVRRNAFKTRALKLYTNPGSRGKMPEWYLSEVGTPYDAINVDMRAKEHKSADYLAINPFGKVPAMTDGDLKIIESGAILLHIARKYGKVSGDDLTIAEMWVIFANATMGDAFFGQRRDDQTPAMLHDLDMLLAKSPYIAGSEFSVSDVAVGSYLLWIPLFYPDRDLTEYKNVWAYMKRLVERPHCPASFKEGLKGK